MMNRAQEIYCCIFHTTYILSIRHVISWHDPSASEENGHSIHPMPVVVTPASSVAQSGAVVDVTGGRVATIQGYTAPTPAPMVVVVAVVVGESTGCSCYAGVGQAQVLQLSARSSPAPPAPISIPTARISSSATHAPTRVPGENTKNKIMH